MDMMLLLQVIILGIVEGLTEFLPISSTGHLIVVGDMLHFSPPNAKVFDVVIQLGAILAVCWFYRARIITLLKGCLTSKEQQSFIINLLIAFMPAALIGLAAHDFIKEVLFSPKVVAVTLIVGGIIILVVERMRLPLSTTSIDAVTRLQAFKIGCYQVAALIPGTSRSGATIIGAMLSGTDRKTAAEFSFFLAMPVMFAATILDLFKARHELSSDGLVMIAVGFVVSFVFGLLSVAWLLKYISKHNFVAFAYYRIVAGMLMLAFLMV
jgi:undecaprenyl-diphosphatase